MTQISHICKGRMFTFMGMLLKKLKKSTKAVWKSSITVFCIGLIWSTSFVMYVVFHLPLFFFGILYNEKLAQSLRDRSIVKAFNLLVAVRRVIGVKMKIGGQPAKRSDRVLNILNHRTYVDWLFFFTFQSLCGEVARTKIVMFYEYKNLPFISWVLQLSGFIFLEMKWSEDQRRIAAAMQYYKRSEIHPQLLLFPEGFVLQPKYKRRSDEYAEQNGLPKYRNVLHPRTKGFTAFIQHMMKENLLDSVANLTLSYPKTVPFQQTDLVKGKFSEVHLHVDCTPVSEIATASEEISEWCQSRWAMKERQLEEFKENKEFSSFEGQPSGFTYDDILEDRGAYINDYACFTAWIFVCALTVVALYVLPAFRWYTVLCTLVGYAVNYWYGGFDDVLFGLYRSRSSRHHASFTR